MAVCVGACVREFYVIQAVKAIAKTQPFRHSHERWLRDFNEYTEAYVSGLSNAMFDYLVLICFGEARHSASYTVRRLHIEGMPIGGSRSGAYALARMYDPWDILEKCEEVFSEGWASGYGGEAWEKIARAAQLRAVLSAEAWLDHCVDLSHNSNLCFDKLEADILTLLTMGVSDYKHMLDMKTHRSAESFIISGFPACSHTLQKLVLRAAILGVIDAIGAGRIAVLYRKYINTANYMDENAELILRYEPISWGGRKLGDIIDRCECSDDDEEDEEEEDDDEEQESEKEEEAYEVDFEYTQQTGCGYSGWYACPELCDCHQCDKNKYKRAS